MKTALVSLSLLCVSIVSFCQNTIIADCESSVTAFGTNWYTFDDYDIGGGSIISPNTDLFTEFEMLPDGASGTSLAAHVNYTLYKGSLSFNPFVGFGFPLNSNNQPKDLSAYSGVSFYHKGDQVNFEVEQSNITDGNSFLYEVPAHLNWTLVTIPFSALQQATWGKIVDWDITQITRFHWRLTGADGLSGDVAIDQIGLVANSSNASMLINNEPGIINNWYTYNDVSSGGKSTINPIPLQVFSLTSPGANNTSNAAVVEFQLIKNTSIYDPYVGFGYVFNVNEEPFDLTGSTGIQFYHKGNACEVQIALSTIHDYNYFKYSIPEHSDWTLESIAWSSFKQPSWGTQVTLDLSKITKIEWKIQDLDGSIGSVGIDEIAVNGLTIIPVTEIFITNGSSITTRNGSLQLSATTNGTSQKVSWTIESGQEFASLQGSVLTANANGTVKIKATALNGASKVFDITITGQLSEPKSFNGPSTVCTGNQYTYTWDEVSGATSYEVKYSGIGAAVSVVGTTATVTYASNATSATLSLKAKDATATSSAKNISVTVQSAPISTPIIGLRDSYKTCILRENACGISLPSNLTSNWTITNNVTIIETTKDSIKFFATDTATVVKVSVVVSNTCGSVNNSLTIPIYRIPVLSGIIGDDTICANVKQQLFSVNNIKGATYTWNLNTTKLPNTSNSVLVDFAKDNATLSVIAANNCGESVVKSLPIVVKSAFAEPIGVVTFSKDNKSMVVAWEHTKGVDTKEYLLLRETTSQGIWEPVSKVPFSKDGIYVDEDVNISQKRYRYKLRTYNTCGDSAESLPHRNMLLQTSYNVGTKKVNLTWAPYEGITVPTYYVYRIFNDGTPEQEVVRVAGNETMAYDDNPVPNTSYRIGFKLLYTVDPTFYHFKADSGPFSQSISNMAESQLTSSTYVDAITKIYPNPASNYISVDCVGHIQVSIISADGKIVLSKEIENEEIISLAGFAKGIYNVRIVADSYVSTQLLIVE